MYKTSEWFHEAIAVDVNNDHQLEVLVSDYNGNLHLLDHNLKLLRKVPLIEPRLKQVRIGFSDVVRLGGSAQPYIILTTAQSDLDLHVGNDPKEVANGHFEDTRLMVLDGELGVVTESRFVERWQANDGDPLLVKTLSTASGPVFVAISDRIYFIRPAGWWW